MGGATLPRMTRHAGFLRLHLRDSGEKAPLYLPGTYSPVTSGR